MSESERLKILQMIERGELTTEEGIRRMQGLGQPAAAAAPDSPMALLERIERGELTPGEAIAQMGGGAEPAQSGEHIEIIQPAKGSKPPISEEELDRWQRWWQTPLYVGLGIVVLSAYWMYSSFESAGGLNFWFFCAWLPLTLGLILLLLSWSGRSGTWLHVRVNEPGGEGKSATRVAVSMPLPLGLASWGIKNFGHLIPNMPETGVDEVINALGATARSGEPFYVNVDDEDGTHVEVYIG
ncbi:MAG: hypothetical protein EPO32_02230 [Anaerolineae bacterium]|nr:MAG: hypothetical protein EPO32_02230 [Anaerolineae bacterium]